MSTELKTIIGKTEHGGSTYSSATISLQSLPDGTESPSGIKGQKMSISLSDESIQLTKHQVKELIATLTNWL
jgi:hypothetical protein